MSLQYRQELVARKMLARLQVVFGPQDHEYRTVTPADFPDLNPVFYDEMQNWFESHGYCQLGDCEDLTLSRVYKESPELTRVMVDKDQIICASFYQSRTNRGRFFRVRKMLSLQTEFLDGTYVATANIAGIGELAYAPAIDMLKLPIDTDWQLLLSAHAERISGKLKSNHPPAVPVGSIHEGIGLANRMHAVQASFRRELGYLTRDEYTAMHGGRLSKIEEGVWEQFERVRQGLC
jgi:hypothetical protein